MKVQYVVVVYCYIQTLELEVRYLNFISSAVCGISTIEKYRYQTEMYCIIREILGAAP